jgi:hypothetical protein
LVNIFIQKGADRLRYLFCFSISWYRNVIVSLDDDPARAGDEFRRLFREH